MKTIEQKAAAYDKAVEKIKYVMEHGISPVLNKEDLLDIFPQLKELEDEKIRKEIKQHFLHLHDSFPDKARWIAWLEKQKPAEWSEEDENRFSNLIYLVQHSDEGKGTKEGFVKFINRLKDRYTWLPSKEQMEQLGWIAEQNKDNMIGKELMTLYNDLKKLNG